MNLDSWLEVITKNIPHIDGVEWRTDMFKNPSNYSIGVVISARFSVDLLNRKDEVVNELLQKVHQITCGGQILLELEK